MLAILFSSFDLISLAFFYLGGKKYLRLVQSSRVKKAEKQAELVSKVLEATETRPVTPGIGNGINSSTVPAYQAEFARPEIRGKLLCAQGTLTITGLCIAYWLDYGLSFVDSGVQWRFPIR